MKRYFVNFGCYAVSGLFCDILKIVAHSPGSNDERRNKMAIFAEISQVGAVVARHFDLVKVSGSNPLPATNSGRCLAVSKEITNFEH